MSLLDELGPSTVSALAQADRCSQPTMTGLVNGLVDKGWLQRDAAPRRRPLLAGLDDRRPGATRSRAVRRRNAALVAERIERVRPLPRGPRHGGGRPPDLLHHD